MSAPSIKVHIVPDENRYPNFISSYPDIKYETSTSYKKALLIERATDGKKKDTQPAWGTLFAPEIMIKLKPLSSGSRVYEIDIGPGEEFYHNTSATGFWDECNFAVQSGLSFSIQKWLFNRREFGIGRPEQLQFQVFALKSSTYLSALGSGGEQIVHPFTYVPLFGGFSFNWQEDGYPQDGLNYWGDVKSVYPIWDSTTNTEFSTISDGNIQPKRFVWGGKVNYSIDLVNMRITFDQDFYDNFLWNGGSPYNIYIKTFIIRNNNVHSVSLQGALNAEFNGSVYYALPHYDLVEEHGTYNTNYSLSYGVTGWTPGSGIQPSIIKQTGLIEFNRSNYPVNNTLVAMSNYYYHSWIRVTNDMTSDLMFKSYNKGGVDQLQIYNYHNNDVPQDGHYDITGQSQQSFVNFTWADIQITNEAKYIAGSQDPRMVDFYLDPMPRGGSYRSTDPDDEEISWGIAGLIDENRPWDHQEGSSSETDKRCFVRATFDLTKFINAPGGGVNPYQTNLMKQMNVDQAFRIKKWFLNAIDYGRKFLVNQVDDDIMAIVMSGNSMTLYGASDIRGSNIIFCRIVYMLYDTQDGSIAVASAPKSWTLKIKGNYFEE